MSEWTTTLAKIREHDPCADGWAKLLKHLGKTEADNEPLSLLTILESNGLDDALWALQAVEGKDKEIRLFAVACARDVQHLMTDQRSIDALNVAERYAQGEATDDEIAAARDAARAAVWDPTWSAARIASWAAADAARAAADAARAAAGAAWAAARAAWAAAGASWDDPEQRLREMVCDGM